MADLIFCTRALYDLNNQATTSIVCGKAGTWHHVCYGLMWFSTIEPKARLDDSTRAFRFSRQDTSRLIAAEAGPKSVSITTNRCPIRTFVTPCSSVSRRLERNNPQIRGTIKPD
jgi:hypothetical protein